MQFVLTFYGQHTCENKRITSLQNNKTCARLRVFGDRASTTRSSAQGNCSAKSLAGNVVNSFSSSLSSTSHAVRGGGSSQGGSSHGEVQAGEGGLGRGRGRGVEGGWGQGGTFHPPCHILHYHMVLWPKGTSHNDLNLLLPRPSCLRVTL